MQPDRCMTKDKSTQTSKIGYMGVNEEPWPFPGALSEAQRSCRHPHDHDDDTIDLLALIANY